MYTYGNDGDGPLIIRFTNGKVRAVYGLSGKHSWTNIQEINFGDSADTIIEKFGSKYEIQQSKDGLSRIYAFPKFHVFFGLGTNKVEVMGIYDPRFPVPLAPKDEAKVP